MDSGLAKRQFCRALAKPEPERLFGVPFLGSVDSKSEHLSDSQLDGDSIPQQFSSVADWHAG
jgi:hypothetical protein